MGFFNTNGGGGSSLGPSVGRLTVKAYMYNRMAPRDATIYGSQVLPQS
jgi:hypothetical protein